MEGERESKKGNIFVLQEVRCDLMSTSSVHLFFLPTYNSYGVLKNAAGGQLLSGTGDDLREKMVPVTSECMGLSAETCHH